VPSSSPPLWGGVMLGTPKSVQPVKKTTLISIRNNKCFFPNKLTSFQSCKIL
jgi:hypothetical protein